MADTTDEITTLGSVATMLEATLRSCDIDPEPLFSKARIDLGAASDPDARFPTHRMLDLWNLAIEATGNPCLGLLAAQHFQPAMLHGLGFAWLASDTLRDALDRLVRYSNLINAAPDYRLEVNSKTTDLVIAVPEDLFPNYVHAAPDAGMAIFLRMCQITVCEPLQPLHTALQRPKPACDEKFARVFGPSVEYKAPENRLCFDNEMVSRTLGTANPELARINDKTVVDYLARFDRARISMQVRSKIIEKLPDGLPKQDHVAETLNVSLRSLQRKLKEEQTSFKDLLEDTRQSLAVQYLREHHRSIGEITYLLGFSEPSNFTSAFKRWTGKTPAEYRDNA